MKGNYIHLDERLSDEWTTLLSMIFSSRYEEALSILNKFVSSATNKEDKQLASLMAIQVMVYSGKKGLASVLLEALQSSLKSEEAKSICRRTIESL